MLGYIKLVQKDYPKLQHYKLSVLKSLDGAYTQYQGCNYRLHSDYHHHVNVRPPDQRPISVMVALDEFEFLYLKDRRDRRGDIITQKVHPKQMIAFTNYCLHAGGANDSGKVCYRLFAYMVSNRDDIPMGNVYYYKWRSINKNPMDDVLELSYGDDDDNDDKNKVHPVPTSDDNNKVHSVPTSISARERPIMKTNFYGHSKSKYYQ